jgi:PAS domain S-box-containing protein
MYNGGAVSIKKFKPLYEHSTGILFYLDLHGKILLSNKKALELIDSKEHIAGKHFKETGIFSSKEFSVMKNAFKICIKNNETKQCVTLHLKNKEGQEKPYTCSIFSVKRKDQLAGILLKAAPVSLEKERKGLLDYSQELIQKIFEEVHDGLVYLDSSGKIIEANKRAVDIFGRSKEYLVGKTFMRLNVIYPKDIPKVMAEFIKILAGKTAAMSLCIHNKQGNNRYLECSGSPIRIGSHIHVFIIVRDVTDRKKAEEALKKSEEQYKAIFELSPEGILATDLKGIVTSCNSAYLKLTGYSKEEILNKHFTKLPLFRLRDIPLFIKIFNGILKGRSYGPIEFSGYHKDGSIHYGESYVSALNKNGKIAGILVITSDITERRRVEKTLKNSVIFNSEIILGAGEGVIVYDKKFRYLEWNPFMEDLTCLKKDTLLGKCALDIFPHLKEQGIDKLLRRALSGETVTSADVLYRSPETGKSGWVMGTYTPHRNGSGDIVGVIGLIRDTTKRKLVEDELRNSEAQLSNAVKIAHLGPWEYDVIHDLFTFNDSFYAIFRTTAKQVGSYTMSSAQYAKHFVHPDDISVVSTEIQKAIETADPNYSRQMEHRIIYADGTIGYISVRFYVIKDSQGKTIKTYGANQDITERKLAEEVLRESEEKYRTLFEETGTAMLIVDEHSKVSLVNNELERMTGYSKEELIGKSFLDFVAQEDRDTIKRYHETRKIKPHMAPVHYQCRIQTNKKGKIWIFSTVSQIPGTHTFLSSLIDITEQKKTEEMLKESEAKFKTVFENAGGAIFIADAETGKLIDCNLEAERLIGHSREEIIGMHQAQLHPKDKEEAYIKKFQNHISNGHQADYNGEIQHKSGKIIPVWISAQTVEINDKQQMVGIFIDMTERVRAEEKLKESEEKYRELVENIHDIIFSIDNNGIITYISPVIESVAGYNSFELVGKQFSDFIFKEDLEIIKQSFEYRLMGKIHPFEYRVLNKDGSFRWVRSFSKPIMKNGVILGLRGVLVDITERKKIELEKEKLQEKLKQYARRLEIKIKKLETKIQLTDKEKLVLYAITAYPGLNDHELAEKIKIHRSTITSIRNRLRRENVYRCVVIPNLYALGCTIFVGIYGSFVEHSDKREKIKELFSKTKCCYVQASDDAFIVMLAARDLIEARSSTDDILRSGMKFKLFKENPKIIYFPFQLSKIYNCFNFAGVLNHLFNLKFTNIHQGYTSPLSCIKLTKNMKEILYAHIKYPEATATELAKKIRLSRETILHNIHVLIKQNFMRKAVIPNIKKLNCELLVLSHLHFNPGISIEKIDASDIARKMPQTIVDIYSADDEISIGVFNDYSMYHSVLKTVYGHYKKNSLLVKEPSMVRLLIKQIKIDKLDFSVLTKDILGLVVDY